MSFAHKTVTVKVSWVSSGVTPEKFFRVCFLCIVFHRLNDVTLETKLSIQKWGSRGRVIERYQVTHFSYTLGDSTVTIAAIKLEDHHLKGHNDPNQFHSLFFTSMEAGNLGLGWNYSGTVYMKY